MQSNEEKVVEICKNNHKTIASCESLTGGLFASTITSVPGASEVLQGAIVSYATQVKEHVVHVPAKLIEKFGVISKECARTMAYNTRDLLDADYCISFTGNAGPTAWEGKPAGRVYCAIISREGNIYDFDFQIDGKSRNEVREEVVSQMMDRLVHTLEEELYG